jgi:hypothetical protein
MLRSKIFGMGKYDKVTEESWREGRGRIKEENYKDGG